MDTILVAIIVGAAVLFTLKNLVKTYRGEDGCSCSGCGCTGRDREARNCGDRMFEIIDK